MSNVVSRAFPTIWVQALDLTRPLLLLTMVPGKGKRPTHDDVRDGIYSLLAALNVATGDVIGQCHRRHRHQEFFEFLNELDSKQKREPGVEIHITLDNSGIPQP